MMPKRHARWPWVLLLALLLLGLGMAAAYQGLQTLENGPPLRVLIEGEPVIEGWHIGHLPPAHQVVLAAVVGVCLVAGLLATLVAVPLALLLVAAATAVLVQVGVGLPLLAVVAVVALLLSPVLLLVWLLVSLVR